MDQEPTAFFQRFQTEDRAALTQKVEQDYEDLARARAHGDEQMQLECLSRLGSRLTILGEEREAAPLLGQALALAQLLGDQRLEVTNLLHLATAQQYLGQRSSAQELFQKALQKARDYHQVQYEDIILQHRGRCFVEQGMIAEARACFEQALILRQERSDPRATTATRQALDALKALE
ncbi:tetratricopeptide repeat protein [Dictyobacter formicarum]|uniref:MalT-like TPR region domain-containing protein n=1 Tax=Dictyobacter formicarum TaxID=2778368 RepID=A0ABQ3VU55_9CHLR|nr:tetratricopeptide repeat protein [Dictyobacter formicarum]GHO89271.1 hypothetical protein KSZ_72770 [Dictyobacter formicarum]